MTPDAAPPSKPPPPRDLSDADFAELDELLAATPEPLSPCDVVMLDGYLCGVIVQPVLLDPAVWLPPVFDLEGRARPDDMDPAWRDRAYTLILRRHAALNRALGEDGWFDPMLLEPDDDAAEDARPTDEVGDGAATLAPDAVRSGDAADEDPAVAALHPVSRSLWPWVAGFDWALANFPTLDDIDDDAVVAALARIYRHLPAATAQDRALVETLDRELPLTTLDDAVEDLVGCVADLWDLTTKARYRVETVRRDAPKPGRNDPCPCGSGKKWKQCHGR